MSIYMWREYVPELWFTANTAGSTVRINPYWSISGVTLETSTDWNTWSSYTMWNTITLSNVWDKVYFRNTSTTNTSFSTSDTKYYWFIMNWSISASWDVNYLINKNSTTTVGDYWFLQLFRNCTALTTAPELPATTIWNFSYFNMFNWCTNLKTAPSLPATITQQYCYYAMFVNCSNLEMLPKLPATTLANFCYQQMFQWCSKIKLSTSQTWEYQTSYRIPTSWSGSSGTNSLLYTFQSTWWSFTGTPDVNTTYYTSNTLV